MALVPIVCVSPPHHEDGHTEPTAGVMWLSTPTLDIWLRPSIHYCDAQSPLESWGAQSPSREQKTQAGTNP